MKRGEVFDYIVVGAGAAGCALADGLSRSGASSILVLESGGRDTPHPLISVPKGAYFLYGSTRFSFTYPTLPIGPEGKPEVWQRGRVDGGSTSINGMQYERAGEGYWDGLADSVGPEWSWLEMLRVFRSLEDHELGASATRGSGGPLRITVTRQPNELNEAILAAAEAFGLCRVTDLNDSDGARIGYVPNTIQRGRRHSAARAFLHPARRRENVTHLRHAHVGWVRFDGRRAVGVDARVRGRLRRFFARKEVILSAGVIESPLLLERSGIGRGDIVARAGAKVIVDNPHVGEHAIEQRRISYQARVKRDVTYNRQVSSPLRKLVAGGKYLMTRRGFLATGAYDLAAFVNTDRSAVQPDALLLINPISMDFRGRGLVVAREPGVSMAGYLVAPTTEGSVHSSGPDPSDPPLIDSRYLEQEAERRGSLRIIEIMREIAAIDPLSELIGDEQLPGPTVATMDQAVEHAWASGHLAHAVGTVRMGNDGDAVLDSTLRVRGVEGLRVADASILPKQPGNPLAPSLAIGARAAELIASDS
ncbi:MAG: GMC family oxidoreductase [Acidimicrobiia bacterium]